MALGDFLDLEINFNKNFEIIIRKALILAV